MAKHRITSVRVTLADGTDHVFEGSGTLTMTRTTQIDHKDLKEPVAYVEVMMPVAAEFTQSRDVVTPSVSLS